MMRFLCFVIGLGAAGSMLHYGHPWVAGISMAIAYGVAMAVPEAWAPKAVRDLRMTAVMAVVSVLATAWLLTVERRTGWALANVIASTACLGAAASDLNSHGASGESGWGLAVLAAGLGGAGYLAHARVGAGWLIGVLLTSGFTAFVIGQNKR